MSLKSALELAKREIIILCEVATQKLHDAGVSADPPEKTYKHILNGINAEVKRRC